MKKSLIFPTLAVIPILALSTSAIIGWSAVTRAETEPANTAVGDFAGAMEESPANQARIAQMKYKKADIIERVGMSAPMELPEPGEHDFIAKAKEMGWIIDTTLEQVEAALKAAAATPSAEDDIAAMRLAHRGSYRFFMRLAICH